VLLPWCRLCGPNSGNGVIARPERLSISAAGTAFPPGRDKVSSLSFLLRMFVAFLLRQEANQARTNRAQQASTQWAGM
jgi:hypothetical protein